MKERSITKKNVTGGFLGGILGILSFGYIHPAVLPLGCVFGVLIGWWYQEILQSALEGWHKGVIKTHEAWNRTVLFLTTPTRKLKGININLEPSLKVLHFLVFLVVWVFRSPITFYHWLGKHQMNQVYTIRVFVVATTLGLTALWMIPLGFKLNQMFGGVDQNSPMGALVILAFILGLVAVISPFARSESLRDFYSSWSAYSRQGTILFFLKEVATSIFLQVAMIVVFSGMGFWFIAIGGAFVAIVIAPLSFAIGMVKGIYKVAMKPGHWLCLITTLVVTLISAWQLHSYFADARILWAVALMAGVVSALATEGLRQLIALFYKHNEFIRRVALTELGILLTPSGRAFWRLSQTVGEKCLRPVEIALR